MESTHAGVSKGDRFVTVDGLKLTPKSFSSVMDHMKTAKKMSVFVVPCEEMAPAVEENLEEEPEMTAPPPEYVATSVTGAPIEVSRAGDVTVYKLPGIEFRIVQRGSLTYHVFDPKLVVKLVEAPVE